MLLECTEHAGMNESGSWRLHKVLTTQKIHRTRALGKFLGGALRKNLTCGCIFKILLYL